MKTTKRRLNLKNFLAIAICLLTATFLVLVNTSVFAAPSGAEGNNDEVWKSCSIIFLILDIVEALVVIILFVILRKINKKRKLLSNLYTIAPVFLASKMNQSIIEIIIFLLLFLVICDLAYRINVAKTKPIEKASTDNVSKPKEIYSYVAEETNKDISARTIEEWYEIEKSICLETQEKRKSVVGYLVVEIDSESTYVANGEGYANRVKALQMLQKEFKNDKAE